MLEFGC